MPLGRWTYMLVRMCYRRTVVREDAPVAVEQLINIHICEAIVLTTAEYERAQREVRGRVLAGDPGISDRILFSLLEHNAPRYYEAKAINARQCAEEADMAGGGLRNPEGA